jgi:HAD superfamily hydrolase (TIGR01509 family)
MKKILVFDFDGVIIDTEKARYDAWQKVFMEYGCNLPLSEWQKNIGRAAYVANPFVMLREMAGEHLNDAILHEKARKCEMEAVADLQLLPGVKILIESAANEGFGIAIASSSTREWVHGHLKRLSIDHFFQTLVCREDTLSHKPFPEPYLTAAKRLGCKPQNGIAIEDSPLGILSAIEAGFYCIGVPCSITKSMDLSHAHQCMDSLENIDMILNR